MYFGGKNKPIGCNKIFWVSYQRYLVRFFFCRKFCLKTVPSWEKSDYMVKTAYVHTWYSWTTNFCRFLWLKFSNHTLFSLFIHFGTWITKAHLKFHLKSQGLTVPLIQIGKKCGSKLSSEVYQDLQLFVSFGGSISGLLRILNFKWLPDKIVMMGSYLNFRWLIFVE